MITIAVTPWAIMLSSPDTAFCGSNPASTTISFLTAGHRAASCLTWARDAADQAFKPPPSWIPRVIGFVPHHDGCPELALEPVVGELAAALELDELPELPHADSTSAATRHTITADSPVRQARGMRFGPLTFLSSSFIE